MIEINKLKRNEENPRFINAEKLSKLKNSISGFEKMLSIRPIIVDSNWVVLGGNMRVQALIELGYKSIPENWVRIASELTEEEKREFIIKDNLGFGEWDWDLLQSEWDVEELEDWGMDIPDFDEDIIIEPEEDNYEEPDQMDVDVVEGDLIEFVCEDGRVHRLLCGDSTDSDAVGELMNGDKADMVFTDPPYGVSYEGGHNKKKRKGIENDTLQGADLTNLFYDSLQNACIFSKDHCAFYIWYASGKSYETFASFDNLPLQVRAVICWYKIESGLGAFMAQYIPNYEPCIYAFKEGYSPQWFGPTDEKTVWELKKDNKNNYHPTQKPVGLPERAIKNSSKKDDLILDLFGGSGSTIVAAHQLKRVCCIMEFDPKYCQVIIDRMQKLDDTIKVKINGKDYVQN